MQESDLAKLQHKDQEVDNCNSRPGLGRFCATIPEDIWLYMAAGGMYIMASTWLEDWGHQRTSEQKTE